MKRIAVTLLGVFAAMGQSFAADPVLLHGAGSLRDAMTEIAATFEAETKTPVTLKFGASGLLRDAIAKGEKAEVFASANMNHPESLAKAGQSGPVRMFARNELCAFARPGFAITSETLLDRMLDPSVKLGTSTPKADPSGDYAFEVFAKAEALKTGARQALEGKALQLTGGPNTRAPVPGRNLYGDLLSEGAADIFLAYCTNRAPLAKQHPQITVVALPASLRVGADYGLTVLNGSSDNAGKLADFIISGKGQGILVRHGFSPPSPAK